MRIFLLVTALMMALALGGCKPKEHAPVQEEKAPAQDEMAQPSDGRILIWKVISGDHVYEPDTNHVTINSYGAEGKTTAGKAFYVRGTFVIEEE
jgi:hypothetical protein